MDQIILKLDHLLIKKYWAYLVHKIRKISKLILKLIYNKTNTHL